MSPIARAIRTFAAAMVGVLGSVVIAAQASDWKGGLTVLTVGVVAALVAGVIAFCTNAAGLVADTPLGKAIATFLQFVAAGLGTVTIASFADVADFPHVAVPLLIAAAVAGLQTFAQNAAESGGAPA